MAAQSETGMPALRSIEIPWVGDSRAPFLMAASIFGSQSFVSLALMYVLRYMRELSDCWGTRYQTTLCLYAWMSLVGATMYLFKYWSRSHIAVNVEGVGIYLFSRSLHWSISTPTQWFVFSQVCTNATEAEMLPVYVNTCMIHVFGTMMYFMTDWRMRWFAFWASSWCFMECFRLAFRLRLRKDMQVVGARLRQAMLVVWTGFPVAVILRWYDLISPWHEQVLFFTVCDVVTKSITFTAILVSRVILAMARINGTVQLVLASHDATVEVSENWQLLDDPASTSLIATYFGENTSENVKLTDLCINEEHQARLYRAAHKADNQPLGTPSPRVYVAFRMPGGGGEMLAECLVSKCCHGRRIIGIAVSSQTGNSIDFIRPSKEAFDEQADDLAAPSEVSGISQDGGIGMQMKLALHNCNDVLRLAAPMQRTFNALFMQQHTAVALFAWEESSLTPAIVVCSPRLQALFFQSRPMPQLLTGLLSSSMVDRLLLATQAEEVIVHQWGFVESPMGLSFEVNLLPLSRMSSLDPGECQVQLCLLVIAFADPSETKSNTPGYLRWTALEKRLICDSGVVEKVRSEEPPRILVPLISSYLESLG